MAKRVDPLFRGPFEGSSEEEEGHHHHPVPPSSDDAYVTDAANDNVGGNWRQGFLCLFVGRLDLSPHVTDAASVAAAAREGRQQRQCRQP